MKKEEKREKNTPGQASYVLNINILPRSRYHYCCTKAISITYSEWVSVATVIRDAKPMRCIILSTAAVPYFSPLSPKRHDFLRGEREGGIVEHKTCVVDFLYSCCLKHFSL